jgi:pimeloyl-ACP methyl ester carboxylesterase
VFCTIGARRVHIASFGSGPGLLVAISGSIGSWEIWQQPFEILSRRWRVVGFDHPGVGETKVPADEIGVSSTLEVLTGVLDALEVETCVVAGDSSNAVAAVQAALEHPTRFRGLIIASGKVSGFGSEGERAFVANLRQDFERTIRGFATVCLPEPDSEHLQSWLIDILRRTGPEACAALLESYYGIDLRDRLADIEIPALVIHGGHDSLPGGSVDEARDLAARIPGARFELIADAGHVPTLSRPEAVATLFDDFMERCHT